MKKDVKKLEKGYKKHTGSEVKLQKIPSATGMTLSKSHLEGNQYINNNMSLVGQLMWYTTKVGPDVASTSISFSVHMSNHEPEH